MTVGYHGNAIHNKQPIKRRVTVQKVGEEISNLFGKRVLVFYGGESAVKSGLLAKVERALQ
ncbi:MAG: hypothetical protein RR689_01700, partial [Mucinivorans sp.]